MTTQLRDRLRNLLRRIVSQTPVVTEREMDNWRRVGGIEPNVRFWDQVADALLASEEWEAREAETMASIAVVAAVIPDDDGALYVQWRSDKQATGWNFPGGKVEAGETLEAALIREIQEECGVTVTLTRHLATGCVRYAKGVHAVHFFETVPVARESIRHLEGHQAAWVDRDTVGSYSFLELDGQVALARLDARKEEKKSDG